MVESIWATCIGLDITLSDISSWSTPIGILPGSVPKLVLSSDLSIGSIERFAVSRKRKDDWEPEIPMIADSVRKILLVDCRTCHLRSKTSCVLGLDHSKPTASQAAFQK